MRPERAAARAFVSLGSNSGDRERNVLHAAHSIDSQSGVRVTGLSPLYETEPVGDGYSSDFINAAARLETTASPERLLELLQEIEALAGRDRFLRRGDRSLDLDIIDYGGVTLDRDGLVLPHPRAAVRLFVLEPLASIEPSLVLPGEVLSVRDLALSGGAQGRVTMISARREIPIELFET